MCSDIVIKVEKLSKCYRTYDKPRDRLMQMLMRGRKQYGSDFWALKDVSFEIKKGQTVGILGRNGSGKSTLLQMICGTLNPTLGQVTTQGRITALLELGSGFNPEFTGRENIYLNASVLGLSQTQINARYNDIVAFADIGSFINQPVKTYSSGMALRLAFAVIAHVDADIIIIDEALAVGDAFFTQKCMRFLREFMQKGTVLFVSHDTASIKSLCSHAIWLEHGKVMQEGTPKDVCESYLEAFYEAQQGKSSQTKNKIIQSKLPNTPIYDSRKRFINSSNLRNDLKVFQFNINAAGFGKGDAQIIDVALLDEHKRVLGWVIGGELVTLRIIVKIVQSLKAPIVGFYIKDRLGQMLFGDNSFLTYHENPLNCATNDELSAYFTFCMPILPPGDYSITVAVANGTQAVHEQHHWIHDALVFRSESSTVATGLVGIPMQQINLIINEEL